MGFDLYGLDPMVNPDGPPKPDKVTFGEDGFHEYVEMQHEFEQANVGVYFRNNVWYWRPLWEYVCYCTPCGTVLTDEDKENGFQNAGHEISEEKSIIIGSLLMDLVNDGSVASYELTRQMELDAQPDETCPICEGSGQRNDKWVQGDCNACHGKGTRRPFNTNYPFSIENVREFAEFCLMSGGFSIC